MTASFSRNTAPQRVCPTCGELLVSSRCPECSPAEPARGYNERVTQPITGAPGSIGMAISNAVDVRRSTSEWVTGPDDRDPQTRRAHPTLVRVALADAEERARDRLARAALITPVEQITRPRHGHTAPRLRPVTPLPPSPPEAPPADLSLQTGSASPAVIEVEETVSTIEVVKSLMVPDRSPPDLSPFDLSPFDLSPPGPTAEASPRPSLPEPRTPEHQLPTPSPTLPLHHVPYVIEPDMVDDRRVRLFWIALLGSAAVLLVLAAI